MDDKALITAVGKSNTEKFERIYESEDFVFGTGFEVSPEQTSPTREIPFPEGMIRMGRQGRVQDLVNFIPRLKPASKAEGCRSSVIKSVRE